MDRLISNIGIDSKRMTAYLAAAIGLATMVWTLTYFFMNTAYMETVLAQSRARIRAQAAEQARADEAARLEQKAHEEEAKSYLEILQAFGAKGLPDQAAQTLWSESKRYGIDPHLALAVARVESDLNPRLIYYNEDGSIDRGLFQINNRSEKWLAAKAGLTEYDPFNPEDSIRMGLWYLSYLNERYQNKHAILTAYNRGENGLKNYLAANGTVVSEYSRAVLSKNPRIE